MILEGKFMDVNNESSRNLDSKESIQIKLKDQSITNLAKGKYVSD